MHVTDQYNLSLLWASCIDQFPSASCAVRPNQDLESQLIAQSSSNIVSRVLVFTHFHRIPRPRRVGENLVVPSWGGKSQFLYQHDFDPQQHPQKCRNCCWRFKAVQLAIQSPKIPTFSKILQIRCWFLGIFYWGINFRAFFSDNFIKIHKYHIYLRNYSEIFT